MKIRILTESIAGLGLGHVVRSFNLALVFIKMGYKVDFFVRGNADFMGFLKKQECDIAFSYTSNFYPLHIQWENIVNPSLLECDICIVDSYYIDNFTLLRQYANILVIFDDDGRHEEILRSYLKGCNLTHENTEAIHSQQKAKGKIFLFNQNGFYKAKYSTNIPHQCGDINQHFLNHVFSGLEYALLNPCFQNPTLKNLAKENEFFVCLGGEDLQDKSAEIFSQLQEISESVTIVVGANYKGQLLTSPFLVQDSQSYLNASKQPYRIFHNISQSHLALLMATSKHCIVSGGGIVFEALKLCKSVFVLNLASNQDQQIHILVAQKKVLELTLPLQKTSIQESISHTHTANNIGSCLEKCVAYLALENLNSSLQQTKKVKNFTLREFHAIDFCNINSQEALRILSYRNHPFIRKNMYGSNEIDEKTHFTFIQSLRNESTLKYFLVQGFGLDIGVISLTRINLKHKHAYLGIYKNPFLQPKEMYKNTSLKQYRSYGALLMAMIKHIAFKCYNLEMLYLEVVESNTKAIAFYENEGFEYLGKLKNGFRLYDECHERFCNILIYGIQNANIC